MSQLMAKCVTDQRLVLRMTAVLNRMAQRTAAGSAQTNANPHGWKSWRDIPDEMIPTTSKRDPDNPIYKTRKYVDYRKKQIWFQMPNDIPVFLKGGTADKVIYYGLWVGITASLVINFYLIGLMIFKPDKLKK